MHGQMVGADVDQLRELTRQFYEASASAEQVRDVLTATVSTTRWMGTDGEAFRSDWDARHRPSLEAAIGFLTVASTTVQQQAQQQEQTSAAGIPGGSFNHGVGASAGSDSEPGYVSDYLDDLNRLKEGEVAVRKVSDDPPRYVVLLRGLEFISEGPNDFWNTSREFFGGGSYYQHVIRRALDEAGVPRGDDVEIGIIGHSQGGMAAIDYAESDTRVRDIITLGSPVGHKSIPAHVESSVSIVNEDDAVPQLEEMAQIAATLVAAGIVSRYGPLGLPMAAHFLKATHDVFSQKADAAPQATFVSKSNEEHGLTESYRPALRNLEGKVSGDGAQFTDNRDTAEATLSNFSEKYAPGMGAEDIEVVRERGD